MTVGLLCALVALSTTCVAPPPRSAPKEERPAAGVEPAAGQVALEDGRHVPVRLELQDAVYSFFVLAGPRLAAWAEHEGALLDVERAALVREGLPPVYLSNVRGLSALPPGRHNGWLFSESLDLWVPLDDEAVAEHEESTLDEVGPGFPWHVLKLELDEDGAGIELDMQVGEAFWRHLAGAEDDERPISLTFQSDKTLLHRPDRRARLERAALHALAETPGLQILLENMHGLKVDPGDFVRARELPRLFEGLRTLHGVPWNLVEDGCGERAMIAGAWLRTQGVKAVKVFVVGELELRGPVRRVEWGFHVAPGVFVDDGRGELQLRILDPALAGTPLSLAAWLSRFAKGAIVIDVLPWFQRNAVEWGGFEREADVHRNLERAWESLDEVIDELRQDQSSRALEELRAQRAQSAGGQRPALSN